MKAPLPANEASRLAALRHYRILDTAPELAYDDITRIASLICGVPIAIVSLVDADRQWFKSCVGLTARETPRDQAFCAYTIQQSTIFEVEDATLDARFVDNALVLGDPNIRFYAGAPLVTPAGEALGSLCVIDSKPHRLTVDQRASLTALARLVMTNIELRRVSKELAQAAMQVKTLSGMLPICAGCKQIRNDRGFWDHVETYIAAHADVTFSHGLCPKCMDVYFPGINTDEASEPAK